jgi:hypothetical protein
MASSGSGQEPVVTTLEHGNGHLGFTKYEELLEYLKS